MSGINVNQKMKNKVYVFSGILVYFIILFFVVKLLPIIIFNLIIFAGESEHGVKSAGLLQKEQ